MVLVQEEDDTGLTLPAVMMPLATLLFLALGVFAQKGSVRP
jgi:hypothetical protein